MLQYSALRTSSFFSKDLLWLTVIMERVNGCYLDSYQVSSLLHDYSFMS